MALTRDVLCAYTSNFPASKLLPLPAPITAVAGREVRVSWARPTQWGVPLDETHGLAGWSVHRSPAAVDDFVEVARVMDLAATEWLDTGVPSGDWGYALQAVFVGPVEGLHLSRKSTVAQVGVPELRVDDRVVWLGPAGPVPDCGPRAIPPLASFLLTPCGAPGPDCSPTFVLPRRRVFRLLVDDAGPDLVLSGDALPAAEPGVLTLYEIDGCSRELLVTRAGDDLILDTR